MAGDADLRARIEAQVAARRAAAAKAGASDASVDRPRRPRAKVLHPAGVPTSQASGAQPRRGVRRLLTRAPAGQDGTPQPTPEPMPQPTPEPMPQPTPEPMPQPTPEPIPQPTPEPIPQPTPDPVPPPSSDSSSDTAVGTPPRPGPGRRGPRPQPSAGDGVRDPSEKRPLPGTGSHDDSAAGAPDDADPDSRPVDLSRFLAASDPGGREDEPAPTVSRRRVVLRRLLRTAVLVAIAAATALVLRIFVVAPYYIPSGSMEPTLHGCAGCNDDHILIDKISYRFHAPQQSDIVVFNRPPGALTPDKVLVKRVIGLPGQHLALRNGYVYIDGKRLRESYLNSGFLRRHCPGPGGPTLPTTNRSQWTVPSGDVFVMGDNRCDSMDSRAFGPIPDSSIIGRAFAIIWPLGRIRLL